ncbi:MAG: class I SAM-dependent methyltransferase [Actinomycetota bacterium]|nr:class I SAM-dependent methyltransferase [Actinomycetota bacterium]MEC8406782.1 class I SAM-dependent methyltransferase [Actinomycetota bacterium]MEC9128486.1 class I SAM-dependent methyltransferase [Actinomycetota bacterium]
MNNDWDFDDNRTKAHFGQLIRDHAGSSRAVDWGSPESQARRFSALVRPLGIDGASILDVGCGQGDLLAYFQERSLNVNYVGVDLTPEMVDHCRERFPNDEFHQGSVLDLPTRYALSFDYVVASGIFFMRQSEPMRFLEESIVSMFECCKSAISFNSLSSWGRLPSEGEFLADPLEVLRIASGLSNQVILQHDYHPGDFTVTIRRERDRT